jgi:ABC-type transporter Mla subunit MlaD
MAPTTTEQLINMEQKALEAANNAADAVRTARDLAVKTEQTTNRLSDTMQKLSEAIIRLESGLNYMQKDLEEIKKNLDNKYVTEEAFTPVRGAVKDHESRIRKTERLAQIGIGALAALQLIAFIWQTFIK